MFKINKQVDYALQFLVVLDNHSKEKVLSLRKFCENHTISFLFFQKIVKLLKDAEMVASVQGVAGGYYLLRDLEDLSIKDVIEAIEGPYGIVYCEKEKKQCAKASDCSVRPGFLKLNNKILEYIEGVSVKTFVNN